MGRARIVMIVMIPEEIRKERGEVRSRGARGIGRNLSHKEMSRGRGRIGIEILRRERGIETRIERRKKEIEIILKRRRGSRGRGGSRIRIRGQEIEGEIRGTGRGRSLMRGIRIRTDRRRGRETRSMIETEVVGKTRRGRSKERERRIGREVKTRIRGNRRKDRNKNRRRNKGRRGSRNRNKNTKRNKNPKTNKSQSKNLHQRTRFDRTEEVPKAKQYLQKKKTTISGKGLFPTSSLSLELTRALTEEPARATAYPLVVLNRSRTRKMLRCISLLT